jgi:hypothetical protein
MRNPSRGRRTLERLLPHRPSGAACLRRNRLPRAPRLPRLPSAPLELLPPRRVRRSKSLAAGQRRRNPVAYDVLVSDPFVPVEGGCSNDYAYVFGDPVNGVDLTGTAACGRKQERSGNLAYMSLTRVGAGIDRSGNRYIQYRYHWALKKRHRWRAQATKLLLRSTSPSGLSRTMAKPNHKEPWYEHGSDLFVKPGTRISFHGDTDFKPEGYINLSQHFMGISVGGGIVIVGVYGDIECVAR